MGKYHFLNFINLRCPSYRQFLKAGTLCDCPHFRVGVTEAQPCCLADPKPTAYLRAYAFCRLGPAAGCSREITWEDWLLLPSTLTLLSSQLQSSSIHNTWREKLRVCIPRCPGENKKLSLKTGYFWKRRLFLISPKAPKIIKEVTGESLPRLHGTEHSEGKPWWRGHWCKV